ncbi:ATP-dependent Clp protease proteolytic subunit [Streptomyces sp. NPDC090106]|uniref:ATP-dependent Clp protease proteolytic subunit n=1 Tax=Streptomyces sp. NPDC090106 TaxID=3365946 RepID=UPI0037FFD0F9
MVRPSARQIPPGFSERTGSGGRTFDPYAKLLDERILMLGTPLDDATANDVVARLMHLGHRAPDRDISLYVNSPGGSFRAMSAVHDAMRYVGCDVETVCLGQATSTAAVLLAAGTPGKRFALPGALMVLQQPTLSGPMEGRVSDAATRARELTRERDRLEEMLARHTGRDRDRVRADIERDLVLDAQGALEYGLVDAVIPHRRATRPAPGDR